jgi:hypothetical protein
MHADMVLVLLVGAVAAISIPAGLVLYPLWKRWARRLEHGDRSPDLQMEVDELRSRVNELEERLDYSERVLTQGRVPGQLEK